MNIRKIPLEGNNSPATGAGGHNAILDIWQMAGPHHTLGGYCWPWAFWLSTGVLSHCFIWGIICVTAVTLKSHLWMKRRLVPQGDTRTSPDSFICGGHSQHFSREQEAIVGQFIPRTSAVLALTLMATFCFCSAQWQHCSCWSIP